MRAGFGRTRPGQLFVCGLVLCLLTGCQWLNAWTPHPFRPPQPHVLSENISKEALVEHLNRNRIPLTSWGSTDIAVTVPGPGRIPVRLSANMAVESPRNFRLIAKSLRGVEADLGSNDEQFWFWFRSPETPHVYKAHHEDAQLVFDSMQIPFQPDWLMQALGVGVLDPNRYEIMYHPAGAATITLVNRDTLPNGRSIEHQIVVNTAIGRIVEHGVYDERNQPIARALLSNYRDHGGISMPRTVELRWPQSRQWMKMSIRELELNAGQGLERMWQFPVIPNQEVIDLSSEFRRRGLTSPRSHSPDSPVQSPGMPGRGSGWKEPVLHRPNRLREEPEFSTGHTSEPVFAEDAADMFDAPGIRRTAGADSADDPFEWAQ